LGDFDAALLGDTIFPALAVVRRRGQDFALCNSFCDYFVLLPTETFVRFTGFPSTTEYF
jgi:hypothetical protein